MKYKLELLKLLSDLSEKEADRMWKRYHAFFLVNSVLLITLGAISKSEVFSNSNLYLLLFSVLGMISNIIWVVTLPWSTFYQDRYIADQKAIIASEFEIEMWFRARTAPRIPVPKVVSFRKLMYASPITFFVLWLSLLIYLVYQILI